MGLVLAGQSCAGVCPGYTTGCCGTDGLFSRLCCRKIRENEEAEVPRFPSGERRGRSQLVRGVQQNGRFPVRQFLRQFMDQHQQVFQSTSRGDHGETGVGHTQ